jgi:hypothetical protein
MKSLIRSSLTRISTPRNTATVLGSITKLIDKLDAVNAAHTSKGLKYDAHAKSYTDAAAAAFAEAGTANTARKKIAAAFGLDK